MRLSKRGEYGQRAAIYIALVQRESPGKVVSIRDIAQGERIPPKFLEQILLTLKNAGILRSKVGVGGGYYLGRPADKITLGQIFRTLDGPVAPVLCVSQMAYEPCDCPDEASCGLRMVMGDVRDAIAGILDNVTLADVVARVRQARAMKQGQIMK